MLERKEEVDAERDRGRSWTYIFCNLQLAWLARRATRKTQLHHEGSLHFYAEKLHDQN
jgi:hypothetical protein